MSVLELKQQKFELPSGGMVYDESTMPLLGGDSVMVRALTAGDHRYIAASATISELYDTMLGKSLTEPAVSDFKVDDLLMGDVIAILVASRAIGLGDKYEVRFTCDYCDEINKVVMSLNDLHYRRATSFEIIDPEEDPEIAPQRDIGKFQADELAIESGGIEYVVHLNRLRDEKFVDKYVRGMKERKTILNETVDRGYIKTARLIDSIDGKKNYTIEDKLKHFDQIMPEDYDEIVHYINKHDIGIVPRHDAVCRSCKESNKSTIQLTAEFFRTAPKGAK